jgi:hypothetical protein
MVLEIVLQNEHPQILSKPLRRLTRINIGTKGGYEIVYKFDPESFLSYYKEFYKFCLEKYRNKPKQINIMLQQESQKK